MTGFAFPEILAAMNDAAQRGDFDAAHALYHRFLPLLVFEPVVCFVFWLTSHTHSHTHTCNP